jgi:hypothetical protein
MGDQSVGPNRPNQVHFLILTLAAALLAPLTPISPAHAASAAIPVPPAIDATGKTDVSAQMAFFFASVPNGSRVVFPSNGRYRMEQTLVLDRRTNLTIEGNRARIVATTPGDAHRAAVRVVRGSNIVIRDLIVQGANPHAGTDERAYVPAKEHQHAFELKGVENVVLERVGALDVYGDFVYLGLDNGLWSRNVTVRNSVFARNGRQGVAIVAARKVLIEGNIIADVRRATFDLEPMGNTAGVDDVVIRDNTIGRGRLLFVAAAGDGPVNHVDILRNRLIGQSLQMAIRNGRAHYRDDWTIAGNTSDAVLGNPLGAAMRIRNVNGLEIADNVQRFQAGRKMVLASIDYSCRVSVHGNSVPGSVGVFRSSGGC